MSLIIEAILQEARANKAKAIANLDNYLNKSVGVAEHPDVVAECSKLVKIIAEADEMTSTINSLIEKHDATTTKEA